VIDAVSASSASVRSRCTSRTWNVVECWFSRRTTSAWYCSCESTRASFVASDDALASTTSRSAPRISWTICMRNCSHDMFARCFSSSARCCDASAVRLPIGCEKSKPTAQVGKSAWPIDSTLSCQRL
jgi:hypothetical protein